MTPACSDQCCTKEPSAEMRTLLCQNGEGTALFKASASKKDKIEAERKSIAVQCLQTGT